MKDLYDIFTQDEFVRLLTCEQEASMDEMVASWERGEGYYEPTKEELRHLGVAA
jgi:hypothetical protein